MLPQIKTIALLISISFMSAFNTVKATEGKPNKGANSLTVTVLENGKVEIAATINSYTALYEIEKSYNNKKFTTIAVLMPTDDMKTNKVLIIKDKVQTGKTKVYYRLKLKENNQANIVTDKQTVTI